MVAVVCQGIVPVDVATEDGAIGNGSRVKVEIGVYSGERATIDTTEKVAILEHEPFETGDDF